MSDYVPNSYLISVESDKGAQVLQSIHKLIVDTGAQGVQLQFLKSAGIIIIECPEDLIEKIRSLKEGVINIEKNRIHTTPKPLNPKRGPGGGPRLF